MKHHGLCIGLRAALSTRSESGRVMVTGMALKGSGAAGKDRLRGDPVVEKRPFPGACPSADFRGRGGSQHWQRG